MQGKLLSIASEYGEPREETKNFSFGGNFDVVYNISPCKSVSPYFSAGFGLIYFSLDNAFTPELNGESYLDYILKFGFGTEWKLWEDLSLVTELDYSTIPTSKFDGYYQPNQTAGFLGGSYDTWMSFNVGVSYYFEKGEKSNACDMYAGIREVLSEMNLATKSDVEQIVKENLPKEIVKEVVVQKPEVNSPKKSYKNDWVLVGVNFANNSAELKVESIPILLHATQILLNNPELEVEIAGYTDNVGTKKQNQKLSEARAIVVKNWLVVHGVESSKLTTIGNGEENPIGDNKTAEGRAMNRRIEFKVINK